MKNALNFNYIYFLKNNKKSLRHFSGRAISFSGGSNVFFLYLFTELHEGFTYPSEFLQLVSNN